MLCTEFTQLFVQFIQSDKDTPRQSNRGHFNAQLITQRREKGNFKSNSIKILALL